MAVSSLGFLFVSVHPRLHCWRSPLSRWTQTRKACSLLPKDQEVGSLFDNRHSLEKHLGGLQAPLTSISKGLMESLDLYPCPKWRGTLPRPHWGGIKEAQRGAWTCTPPPRERVVSLPLSIEPGEARGGASFPPAPGGSKVPLILPSRVVLGSPRGAWTPTLQ